MEIEKLIYTRFSLHITYLVLYELGKLYGDLTNKLIMDNMEQVKRDLKLAQIEARKLKEQLHATPLWKSYQLALHKESHLERQLEFLQVEAMRAKLEEEFECVTGHEYADSYHEFLIVHKDCPHITSFSGVEGYWEIGMKGKTTLPRDPDYLILAVGDSEEEAWKQAVKNWNLLSHYQKDCMLGKV